MKKSRDARVNKPRKIAQAFTIAEERQVLDYTGHKTINPGGLQKQFVFYCTLVFFIRGNKDLYNTLYKDFKLGINANGKEYVVIAYT